MTIHFTKMHAVGNDFLVIDGVRQHIQLTASDIVRLSDRHTGIGFDQCLLIEACSKPDVDFIYRIFNANGHEVGQCGNGARCVARFAKRAGLIHQHTMHVQTKTTHMQLDLNVDDSVTVHLEEPNLLPANIPLKGQINQAVTYDIPLSEGIYPVHAINVGNPHVLMVVENLIDWPVNLLGKQISEHAFFPEQTNVSFMQIHAPDEISLRVYERGCGETRACGSGAVAASALGMLYHQLADQVTIHLPGGTLSVRWPNQTGTIYLTGPAVFVYDGILNVVSHIELLKWTPSVRQ
jgi:diaminopimelate epimerase